MFASDWVTPLKIWTDGGCCGRVGGWAAIVGDVEISGRVEDTTNNRMEMTAAIKALELVRENGWTPEVLYSDSQYLVKGMTIWMPNWRMKMFVGVKNTDLWKELLELPPVRWQWVKGHAGNVMNERCDALVKRAMYASERIS